jgi:polar amino acid transport system substrate-binding protein
MRRWLSTAAVVALAASVAISCGGDQDAGGSFDPSTPGTLTVATSLPALGFWDGEDVDDLTGGFEWGIAEALGERFHVDVTYLDLPFEQLAAGDLGEADVALAQISITDERLEIMDLSEPYYLTHAGALARNDVELRDLADAKELRWVVEESTTEQEFLEDVIRPDDEPIISADRAGTLDALRDGRAEVALLDLPTAMAAANQSPDLEVPAQFATEEQYAVALPKDSENTEAVSTAIRAFASDGTIDDLIDTYLTPLLGGDPDDIRLITTRPSEG